MEAFSSEIYQTLKNYPKVIKLNQIGKIVEIHFKNKDYISLNIENDETLYKGLIIIKGEIFPIPRINDLIEIQEISFKYDHSFQLKFFIKGKLLLGNSKNILVNGEKKEKRTIDLTELNIVSTLKKSFNINKHLFSNLFIVCESRQSSTNIDSTENKKISNLLKSMENMTIYSLENSLNIFQKNDILFINHFDIIQNKIELTPFSLIEKLSDEKLFLLIQNNHDLKSKYFYGKIVEINDYLKIIYIINNKKKLFTMNISNYEVKIGQFCLISNYEIIENKENKKYPFINLLKNSFIYFSNQNIYFIDDIYLNYSSIIQFHFLDFKKEENKYNKIQILDKIKDIKEEQLDFVFECKKMKGYEIYPITIKLIDEKKKYNTLSFEFLLVHGLINKINTFINYSNNKSYFYEYLYYSFNDLPLKSVKEININNVKKYIFIYDCFSSSNRIRINILNIPYQNECEESLINEENSLLVCETFQNIAESKIYGVFNISEIGFCIPKLFDNEKLDIYYDTFGNLIDYLNYSNINYNNIIEEFIIKYDHLEENLKKGINEYYYYERINKSQFSTRIGILISSFLHSIKSSKRYEDWNKIIYLFNLINNFKNKINFNQFLRLFNFLLDRYKERKNDYYIQFFSELEEDSPYLLAKDFNIKEITNINEKSRLFLAYLQMDSYILHNYSLNKEKSYSLSIEPLFIVKHHLIENYDDFFFIEYYSNKSFASHYLKERITVINELNLFNNDINSLKNIKEKKDSAFSISMEFRHEKNSHQKKNIRNRFEDSPIYYCDNGNIKKILYFNEKNKNIGEDGKLVESFINSDPNVIRILKEKKIFGELLDYSLFIQKDFSLLNNKINEILKINSIETIKKEESETKDNIHEKYETIIIKEVDLIKDKNKLEERIKEIDRLKRLGTINIGDIYYSEEIRELWRKNAMQKKDFSELPQWVIDLKKEEEEEEEEDKE